MSVNAKSILKSKTIWGILIAALPTVLRVAGVPIPPGIENILNEVLVGLGSGLGIYGRVTATQRVALRPKN